MSTAYNQSSSLWHNIQVQYELDTDQQNSNLQNRPRERRGLKQLGKVPS